MPNLWGANPVGRGEGGGRSFVRGTSGQQMRVELMSRDGGGDP